MRFDASLNKALLRDTQTHTQNFNRIQVRHKYLSTYLGSIRKWTDFLREHRMPKYRLQYWIRDRTLKEGCGVGSELEAVVPRRYMTGPWKLDKA